jgi:putative SOS response-associated peptidase YedK
MCANYEAVTATDRLAAYFGVAREQGELPFEFAQEVWPTGLSPFIRRKDTGESVGREVVAGNFGMVPHFKRELAYGRKTYNARSETVHQLATFRTPWARGQRCIVPAEAIYEPCYLDGHDNVVNKPTRYRIQRPGAPMGIAGIWYEHPSMKDKAGKPLLSFAMLTVNADGHPVFKRMHKPGDEKRMVVILDEAEYDRWLQCSVEEARTFFRQWHGMLDAFPAPLPARGSRKQAADPEPASDD